MKRNIHVMMWGGIGDVALSTPIFKELKLQNPNSKIVAICKLIGYKSVLQNNPHIDILRNYNTFYKYYYKLFQKLKV